jgi:hypothetical protein
MNSPILIADANGDLGGVLMAILFIACGVLFYFLPAMLGSGKRNSTAIFALNLLLGWTFIGWVIALVWALMDERPATAPAAPPPEYELAKLRLRIAELERKNDPPSVPPELIVLLAAVLLAGCSTTSSRPQAELPRGSGRVHVFSSPFTNTWMAAVSAVRVPLTIRAAEMQRGYIGADSPARMESWGERVSVWLWATNSGTAVEVSTQLVGPSLLFKPDWAQPIFAQMAAQLGEPIPIEPPVKVVKATSPRDSK